MLRIGISFHFHFYLSDKPLRLINVYVFDKQQTCGNVENAMLDMSAKIIAMIPLPMRIKSISISTEGLVKFSKFCFVRVVFPS